jgi:hypothetical protein
MYLLSSVHTLTHNLFNTILVSHISAAYLVYSIGEWGSYSLHVELS